MKTIKLSEIGDIVGGATPSTQNANYYGGLIPWITPKDLSNYSERYISRGERSITEAGLASASLVLMPPNSVLFSSRAPIGYVAIAANQLCTNQGFKSIVPYEDKIDYMYLYYLMKYKAKEIESLGSGTTFKEVSGKVLKNIKVKIHDHLPEQRAIADTLSCLDDKIELNNRINKTLEETAQAIFISWFVDFEPWDGVMPEGWREGALGQFIDIKRGGSPRPIQEFLSNTGLRWLKISDVTALQTPFVLEIKEHIKETGLKKTVFLKSGSLVLSNSATPGIPKILGVDACIHDGWLYFPTSKFSSQFLYLFFRHIRQDLVALGNGSVFTNLKTDILKNFPIAFPGEAILQQFDEIIVPIFQKMENCSRESAHLSTLRDALLPKLMSGEIRVPTDNIQ